MPKYSLYGLVLQVDVSLAGLPAALDTAPVDIDVRLASGPPSTATSARADAASRGPERGESRALWRDSEGTYWLSYDDGVGFAIERDATTVHGWWSDGSTLEDTATYLVGPVLGFALRRRGVLALHASAVLLDGRAVALVGGNGAGKSTTAAAFAAAGVPVLTDDVLALRVVDGVTLAYPSYQLVRLWDESERIVFGTTGQLPLITPTWDKRGLPLTGAHEFWPSPAPLGDLFVFAARTDDAAAPRVAPLDGVDALAAMISHSYANDLLDDAMRAEEMRAIGLALRGRRFHTLIPSADPSRLNDLLACVRRAVAEEAVHAR